MELTSDPDAPWCRGCGGTGVHYRSPAWVRAVLRGAFQIEPWISPVTGRHRGRLIPGVSAPEGKSFIEWVHRVERVESTGAPLPAWVEAIMENPGRYICMTCHGTGRRRYERSSP